MPENPNQPQIVDRTCGRSCPECFKYQIAMSAYEKHTCIKCGFVMESLYTRKIQVVKSAKPQDNPAAQLRLSMQ
jgi:hypothetical protein